VHQADTDRNIPAIADLRRISHKLSKQIIEITTEAGSGYPSSSYSMIDILTVLYFGGMMDYDPERPDWSQRDRFTLNKGHGAPGLYVNLAEAGFFDPNLLPTLRESGDPDDLFAKYGLSPEHFVTAVEQVLSKKAV
jgi:transketolase N-terminal domain/subunit